MYYQAFAIQGDNMIQESLDSLHELNMFAEKMRERQAQLLIVDHYNQNGLVGYTVHIWDVIGFEEKYRRHVNHN